MDKNTLLDWKLKIRLPANIRLKMKLAKKFARIRAIQWNRLDCIYKISEKNDFHEKRLYCLFNTRMSLSMFQWSLLRPRFYESIAIITIHFLGLHFPRAFLITGTNNWELDWRFQVHPPDTIRFATCIRWTPPRRSCQSICKSKYYWKYHFKLYWYDF